VDLRTRLQLRPRLRRLSLAAARTFSIHKTLMDFPPQALGRSTAQTGGNGIPRDGSRFSPLTQDLSTNAQAAVAVWRHQGWGAWGTYNNGAWKHFFPGETPGVSSNALAGLQGREPSGGPSATLAGQAASGGGGSPASRGFAPGAPIVLSAGEISGLVLFIAGILAFAAFGGVAKATS